VGEDSVSTRDVGKCGTANFQDSLLPTKSLGIQNCCIAAPGDKLAAGIAAWPPMTPP
jgi:hypothetical protein